MWKPNKKCKTCALILSGDKDLQKRIYNSKYFGNDAGETLVAIAEDYGALSLNNLVTHANRHQNLTASDKVRRSTQAIAGLQESKAASLEVVTKAKPDDIWESVLDQGLQDLKEGKIRLSANNILKAAADKTTADIKKKDQELKITEMIWHFASGESDGSTAYDRALLEGKKATDYDAAALTARSVESVSD